MLAGIDEAGRGPVLGPLVVAGIAVASSADLEGLDCRDSKQLSPGKRDAVARQLRNVPGARIALRSLEPAWLDQQRVRRTLNDIEAAVFGEVAAELQANTVVVDAADVDAARFGRDVARSLPRDVTVVSEHKADANHAIVAAASILAKVERDRAIAELARRLERKLDAGLPLGSGYPSDPLTVNFLRTWVDRFGDLPDGARRSWAPAKELLAPKATRLDQFG